MGTPVPPPFDSIVNIMTNYIRKSVQKLHAYVPGEQPKAADLIKLNTNECPYPPSPAVAKALSELSVDSLRRYPDPLCMALREEVARQNNCSVDQVIFGNGSDELLAMFIRAYIDPKDGAIGYFDPSYSLYPVLSDIADVDKRPVSLNADFSWAMPADYDASLFLVTNPNAPTSKTFKRSDVEHFCDRFNGVVVIDEAYADFAEDNYMDLALSRDNVLVCRTFSKSYALAGIRLGYAVGPKPLIDALYKVKDSYNVNTLTQCVGLAALSDRDYFQSLVTRVKKTREQTTSDLKMRGFSVEDSQSNFLWASPPECISAVDLFEELRKNNVFVRYFPDERIANYLRISIGSDVEMARFLEVVDKALPAR